MLFRDTLGNENNLYNSGEMCVIQSAKQVEKCIIRMKSKFLILDCLKKIFKRQTKNEIIILQRRLKTIYFDTILTLIKLTSINSIFVFYFLK